MKRGIAVSLLAVVGMALCAGCGGPATVADGPKAPAADITPRKTWRAEGTVRDAALAIDGDKLTAATGTGRPGDQITIDLGKVCLLNTVVIDHGGDGMGFSRQVEMSVSLDGLNFESVHTAPGTRGVTYVLAVRPVLARYVRLRSPAGSAKPWSLTEVFFR